MNRAWEDLREEVYLWDEEAAKLLQKKITNESFLSVFIPIVIFGYLVEMSWDLIIDSIWFKQISFKENHKFDSAS